MPDQVRVRMYNVGFGDCFLVEFPGAAAAPTRILVDCGAHTSGYPREGWKPADTAKQIVADITEDGSAPAIDVVVASHRHQDHVSGFAAGEWASVSVDQVWLPWTENPNDRLATDIRNRQSRLALGLQFASPRTGSRSAGKRPRSLSRCDPWRRTISPTSRACEPCTADSSVTRPATISRPAAR